MGIKPSAKFPHCRFSQLARTSLRPMTRSWSCKRMYGILWQFVANEGGCDGRKLVAFAIVAKHKHVPRLKSVEESIFLKLRIRS